MKYLQKFIDKLAGNSAVFEFLRRILELNFIVPRFYLRKFLGDTYGLKVLDVGCGTGEMAKDFSGSDYYGIDISRDYIEYARQKNKGKFQVMDATKMEFPDSSFDIVFVMAILHHLNDSDTEAILSEVKRVLRPGGKFLIMDSAKIKSWLNFITIPFQKMDQGNFIRPVADYERLVRKYFLPQAEGTFRSGVSTFAYFFIVSNK
ncbi:MAG: hypothetical protein A2826_02705 [Candidatus Doudnabacteria bacterium RIFCSPHIGHO2_01_FULL_43_23]|uniref:Methyltransferase type 11 domain-containing protein n=1 Tax=Candidatus Doudnabacteria bacterium RIFCSPHIGHO2_01_FULL_43_23 TaxID=1817822 RepID=A0A1F5NRP7_9BACT|nr:MAG: hypothetical protein A2826_02705 [Candidatus Doudnabacteria bacterium RIFCSPHIGHO2_01_FULL_43_23]